MCVEQTVNSAIGLQKFEDVNGLKQPKSSVPKGRHGRVGDSEVHRLLAIVERSQVPFGESASLYGQLKNKIETEQQLTTEEYEHLLRLVKIAKDWEKGVESSARTEPEETLAG